MIVYQNVFSIALIKMKSEIQTELKTSKNILIFIGKDVCLKKMAEVKTLSKMHKKNLTLSCANLFIHILF
jgi:hypothetical protein